MANQYTTPTFKLRRWLDAELGRQQVLAEECGIHFSIVSRWRTGERVPSLKRGHRAVIERLCGIPVAEWDRVDPPPVDPFEAAFGGGK